MYIHIKVTPGARKEAWKEKDAMHFEASVKERAQRNMANARVIALTAQHFGVEINKIRIVNGHQSPSKLLSIEIEK